MLYLKRKIIRVHFLVSNEYPVSGNDYRSFSPTRGKGPEDPSVTLGFQTQCPNASRNSFYIFLHFISSFLPSNLTIFTKPKFQIEFTILALIANHLCEENPSLFSILEPLHCSSYATAVEGIRFINFVDSGIPYYIHESNGAIVGDGALVQVLIC